MVSVRSEVVVSLLLGRYSGFAALMLLGGCGFCSF